MSERIHLINHRGKQVLMVDFSNCASSEVERIARAVPDYVITQPRGSVLVLSDFTGASLDQDAIRTIKETAVFDKPYINKSALVGGGNLSKVLGENLKDFSRREFPAFKTRQEALSWLVGNE
jgi:hypothetical protein